MSLRRRNKPQAEPPDSDAGEDDSRRRSSSSGTGDVNSSSSGDEGQGISVLDILRVLATLVALWLSLSYYLTSGDSLTFNYRPWFTRANRLKAYIRGPLLLSPSQLSLHNGTSYPDLPILLAINGTIFDVSASPHTYGPGGSYHIFAGRDATRAFVTGCFSDDLVADLAGVERMFIPVEDEDDGPEGYGDGNGDGNGSEEKKTTGLAAQSALTSGQRKIRAEREKREAKAKVRREVEKWVRFYGRSEKYFEVGKVVGRGLDGRDGAGLGTGETVDTDRVLCDAAERNRPRRSQLNSMRDANADQVGQRSIFRPKSGGKPV